MINFTVHHDQKKGRATYQSGSRGLNFSSAFLYEPIYFITFILSYSLQKTINFTFFFFRIKQNSFYLAIIYPVEPLINLRGNLAVFFFCILKHFTISSSFINYSQLCIKKDLKKKKKKNDGITWKNTTVKYSVTIASSCSFFTA